MRLTTEDNNSDVFSKYTLLIRTRIQALRRLEYVLKNGKICWKEARKLVINSELKSTGALLMPTDKGALMAYFFIGS